HLEELMAGYVLDNLSPEEAEEFERLLAQNPQLVTEVNRLQEVLEVLPYALPEVEPPPHLREAILNAAADLNRQARRKWSRLPWGQIMGSAAALFALALGLDNYRLRQALKIAGLDNYRLQQEIQSIQLQKSAINVLQQPNTRLFSLTGTDKAHNASGSIILNLDQRKGAIAFQNLPAPPAERIYRLWAIVDNQKILCADFSTSQQGKVLEEFAILADACGSPKSTLAVTLEPSPSPPQPVGPLVMLEKS
ncbi:MAG TPA: hypothetical protein DDZ80_18795, partial [Cyanobacteria bacterium UBA8803]|nr:hypothetical protein [Cyanobacteria bacterium UBA8803]